jgi:hypothetical protein
MEALERSLHEDKPILLSIGYAACHWCHVMEHESFEDEATAKLMNENFVSIKVDREERTDLDEIYMKAVQLMTGQGGWPMTVFLTPQLKPFFGGTYFPPEDRHGLPSLKRLLIGISEAWKTRRAELEEGANNITEHLHTLDDFFGEVKTEAESARNLDREMILDAAQKLLISFDDRWGGFGNAPKFPHTFSLALSMRCASHLCGHKASLKESFEQLFGTTLNRMAYGGMHDQIGGGFARYSVDRQWLVPHFEKMLYDNALLCQTYLDGYLLTGRSYWKMVAEDILAFVERDLSTGNGAFYSSLDADSEGVEGKFYLWTIDQVEQVLDPDDAAFFSKVLGLSTRGNFEHGTNILHLIDSPEELAAKYEISTDEFWLKLMPLKQKLLAERSKRVPPGRDEKVLTSWNSLIASAFIDGYKVTGNERYLALAQSAVNFILNEMISEGRLLRTWGKGKAKLNGYLDDYTYFTQTLLDLSAVDGNSAWLNEAISLTETTLRHFSDDRSIGLFYTSDDHEALLARPKSHFDGSVPSGISVAIFNFLRLGRITGDERYGQRAKSLLTAYQPYFSKMPDQFANMICALDFALSPSPDIVVTTPKGAISGKELLFELHRHYLPNKVVVVKHQEVEETGGAQPKEPLLLRQKSLVQGKAAIFICQDFSCKKPITQVSELKHVLESASAGSA